MLNIKTVLATKGISTKSFADFLNVSEKTAYNKLMGLTDFTYPEAEKVMETLLPEYNARYLFSRADTMRANVPAKMEVRI